MGLSIVAFVLAVGAVPAHAQAPARVLSDFARLLEQQTTGAARNLLSAEGVRLRLGESSYEGSAPRRALAALERSLGEHRDVRVSVRSVSVVDGTPSRAFGELAWEGIAAATGESLRFTIFVGLSRIDGSWLIDEIRTIRT